MPRFVTPTAEQIRSVLRESHALWGAGLSVADYLGMWEEMADSRWGRGDALRLGERATAFELPTASGTALTLESQFDQPFLVLTVQRSCL